MKKKMKKCIQKFNSFISQHRVFSAIIFSCIVSSLCLVNLSYVDTDNILISMVLNQRFGAENYCIFLNYVFCKIVLLINFILPNADGYMLICHALLYISQFWIAYIIFSVSNSMRKRLILLMIATVLLMGFSKRDLSNQNFTIQAGALATVGAISIFAGMHARRIWPYLVMAVLFLMFGAMIRMNGCLLVMPYIFLHIFVDLLCTKNKDKIKRATLMITIPMLAVGLIYIINIHVNSSEKYKSGYEFNAVRSALVDYPQKDWDEISEYLPDITKNDYMCIKRHLYGDTERNNITYFKKIASVSKQKKDFLINDKDIIRMAVALFLFLILSFLFCIFFVFKSVNWWRKTEIICAALGTMAIFTFYIYIGRMIQRVCITPILMYIVLICHILLFEEDSKIKGYKLLLSASFVAWALSISIFVVYPMLGDNHLFRLALYTKTGADESKFEKYYGEDNLYVWDTFTLDGMGYMYFAKQGKLPTEEFLVHNVPQGEWIYGQLYMEEYFEKIKTRNPVRALVERENTYYVSEDKTLMETYLKENVNPNTYAIKVDSIGEIPIWKFEIEDR